MDPIIFLVLVAMSWLVILVLTNNRWVKLQNPEVGLGFAMFRTVKFNRAIDSVASLNRRFWRFFFDIGLLVCLGFVLTAVLLFAINMVKFLQLIAIDFNLIPSPPPTEEIVTVDFVPAIPGLSISFETLPYFMVAITIAAALHELAHGVAARAEGIKLKSTGLVFFLFFFGAFVEPEEKSVTKATVRQRLRVYSAGAFINLLLVLVFLLLLTPLFFNAILSPGFATHPDGALIVDVCPAGMDSGCPAEGRIAVDDVIVRAVYANGTELVVQNNVDFSVFSAGTEPGERVQLYLLGRAEPLNLTTVTHPSDPDRGMIGVMATDYYPPHFDFLPLQLPYWLLRVFFYTLSLSLVLALLNLLPIPPLDGDKLIAGLVDHFKPENAGFYKKWIRLGTLVLFLGNLILTFAVRGWQTI